MSDNTAQDLVQTIFDQNYTAATEIFNDMIGQKMHDALEQEKISVASQIYNGEEPEEDEFDLEDEDLELDDEDFEIEDEDEEVEN